MKDAPLVFPLTLQPVVRSREGGAPEGRAMPYHAAIRVVDAGGRHVIDVAPGIDDVLGGRVNDDPHQLVSRASRVVGWLHALHGRLASWIEPLECPPGFEVRAFIGARPAAPAVEAGVLFCGGPAVEFDRITHEVRILADEAELSRVLEPLRQRVLRRHAAAAAIFTSLQDAVHSWRITEQLAAGADGMIRIEDSALEH